MSDRVLVTTDVENTQAVGIGERRMIEMGTKFVNALCQSGMESALNQALWSDSGSADSHHPTGATGQQEIGSTMTATSVKKRLEEHLGRMGKNPAHAASVR